MKRLIVLLFVAGSALIGAPALAAAGGNGGPPGDGGPPATVGGPSEPGQPEQLPAPPAPPDQGGPPADVGGPAAAVIPPGPPADPGPPEDPGPPQDPGSLAPVVVQIPPGEGEGEGEGENEPGPPDKVWVCKYVGKPGVDERLKEGKNPISVSSASTGGTAVGNYFADGQDRSLVVAVDDGGPEPTCPGGTPLTKVTAASPAVAPPTCVADGMLVLPTTEHVTYTPAPAWAGPGNYVVTATAAAGYELVGTSSFPLTVLPRLTGAACEAPLVPKKFSDAPAPRPATPTVGLTSSGALPDTGAQPDDGPSPWWLALAAPLAAGSALLLARRSREVEEDLC